MDVDTAPPRAGAPDGFGKAAVESRLPLGAVCGPWSQKLASAVSLRGPTLTAAAEHVARVAPVGGWASPVSCAGSSVRRNGLGPLTEGSLSVPGKGDDRCSKQRPLSENCT